MSYEIDVFLLDTQTGERVVYRDTGSDVDGAFNDFLWSEGNFACDCNRGLCFERAKGHEPAWNACPCGDGRYMVEKIVCVADGRILYADDGSPYVALIGTTPNLSE